MRKEGDDFEQQDDPGGGRSAPSEPARSGVTPRRVIIVIVAIILIAFGIANFETAPVNFLFFDTQARVVTVIVVAGALGFVIGYFVGRPSREERKYLRRRDRRLDDD